MIMGPSPPGTELTRLLPLREIREKSGKKGTQSGHTIFDTLLSEPFKPHGSGLGLEISLTRP